MTVPLHAEIDGDWVLLRESRDEVAAMTPVDGRITVHTTLGVAIDIWPEQVLEPLFDGVFEQMARDVATARRAGNSKGTETR